MATIKDNTGEIIDSELTPDFIAEALKTDIYTESGVLSHAIIADRMEHYAKLEVTHFELPKYTLYPQTSSVKQISYKVQTYQIRLLMTINKKLAMET